MDPELDDPAEGAEFPAELEALFSEARREAPSPGELAKLRQSLAPRFASPMGSASTSLVAVKIAVGLLMAGALLGGWLWTRSPHSEATHRVTEHGEPARVVPAAPVDAAPLTTPSDAVPEHVESPAGESQPQRPDASRTASSELPSEEALIDLAQRSLASAPRRSLRVLWRHEALYADGMLAQEREVLAVTALVRVGEHAEAVRRAERFTERWPASAHLRRVRQLVETASDSPERSRNSSGR